MMRDLGAFMACVNLSCNLFMKEVGYIVAGVKIINLLEIEKYLIIRASAIFSKSLIVGVTVVGMPIKPMEGRV